MDNDEIIRLYRIGHSMNTIAKMLKMTESKVRWRLHKVNIHRDASGTARAKFETHITEPKLRAMYIDQKMSGRQIAIKLGLTTSRVHKWLVQFNISRRTSKEFSTLRDHRLCKRGKEHPSWRGGRHKHSDGHILVYAPDHPRQSRNYVSEHILVWEQTHNQSVPKGWEIHHLNGINDDNSPGNLLAVPSHKHKILLREYQKRIRQLESDLKALKKQRNLL